MKSTKRAVKYVLQTVWRERPSSYFYYFIKLMIRLVLIIQSIYIPKLIIDEISSVILTEGKILNLKYLITCVLLQIGTYFIGSLIGSTIDKVLNITKEFFSEFIDIEVSKKTISLNYEDCEDPEVLDKKAKAKDGIDWYSGGVLGLFDTFYEILANIVIGIMVSLIIVIKCPILIPVQIIAIWALAILKYKLVYNSFCKLG